MAKKKEQDKAQNPLPEAPASINVRFYYRRFDVQTTVRDESLAGAWEKITWLIEKKLMPHPDIQPKFGNNSRSSPPPKAKANDKPDEPREDWCPIHDCEMPEWTSKDGKRNWRSHKIDGTDDWCKGK